MSALFGPALAFMLPHEGMFSDNKADPGGATFKGITLTSARSSNLPFGPNGHIGNAITVDDLKAATDQQVSQFYLMKFWNAARFADIADQSVANKLFDEAVNTGLHEAVLFIQRAARACGHSLGDDGDLGDLSIAAINAAAPDQILAAMRSESAGFYRLLAVKNPSEAVFLTGWLSRAYC